MTTPRRSFLGRLTALLALGASPSALAASAPLAARDAGPGATGARWPDERWLEMLASRERRARAARLATECRYVELSARSDFQKVFLHHIGFPPRRDDTP